VVFSVSGKSLGEEKGAWVNTLESKKKKKTQPQMAGLLSLQRKYLRSYAAEKTLQVNIATTKGGSAGAGEWNCLTEHGGDSNGHGMGKRGGDSE